MEKQLSFRRNDGLVDRKKHWTGDFKTSPRPFVKTSEFAHLKPGIMTPWRLFKACLSGGGNSHLRNRAQNG